MAALLKVIMSEDEERQVREDMRLLGAAWVYVATDKIGVRVDPARVMLKPQPVRETNET